MLDNISSKYILKYLLNYISEKKKLILFKYNKSIQTKLNIKLLNYKVFSGNYTTIYEYTTKVKIYDESKDALIYEGGYLNGQKNGKGKEYDINGKLNFEGQYLKGEKNGKGKEYYDNGELKFEGEYNYGKRNGKGKEYYKNGELKFEGEYINGKMLMEK